MNAFTAVDASDVAAEYLDSSSQVRGDRTRRKGLLRVTLLDATS